MQSTAVRVVLTVGVLAAVLAAVLASWRAPDVTAVTGYHSTITGPLSAADVDMLGKVRQAGLWEMPAGQDLAERGHDPKVREIGEKISAEHHELNDIVDKAAAEVGVALPAEASVEQQAWVRQIADSPDPDAIGVNLLRQAHGKVLPLLANVKVGTRNETARRVATEGMVFVTRHIAYLESTGLVDYSALPEPPTPSAAVSPIKATYYYAADRPTLFAALAVLAVLIGVLTARLLRRPVPRAAAQHSRHRRRT